MSVVGACLASVPETWLVTHSPPKHMVKQQKLISNQEKHIQDMVLVLAPLLHSPDRNLKVTAFHLLKKYNFHLIPKTPLFNHFIFRLLKELVKKDEDYLLSVENDAVDVKKLACELFGQELAETHTVVEAMLMDFRYNLICLTNYR
jgi:hypothetical protein